MPELELPEMIQEILISPSFDKAWEEASCIGIGKIENYQIVYERMRQSDFLRDRISQTTREIIQATDPLCEEDLTHEDVEKVFDAVLEQVITVAIAHMITGMMIGAIWYIKATEGNED